MAATSGPFVIQTHTPLCEDLSSAGMQEGGPTWLLGSCTLHGEALAFCHAQIAETRTTFNFEAAAATYKLWPVQFLCRGLEDYVTFEQQRAGQQLPELEQLVQASGKMVLLNKLLPKLRAEGHKVCCCACTDPCPPG